MKHPSRSGFTLVEVVLALGIASFAILALVALLPAGAASTKSSLDESNALNILSQVIADRKATPYATVSTTYKLAALTPAMAQVTDSFGIQSDNSYTATPTAGRYRVDCTLIPPATGTASPYLAQIRISWPPVGTALGSVETVAAFPQP